MLLRFIEYRLTSLFRKEVRHFIFNVSIQPLPSFTPTADWVNLPSCLWHLPETNIRPQKTAIFF